MFFLIVHIPSSCNEEKDSHFLSCCCYLASGAQLLKMSYWLHKLNNNRAPPTACDKHKAAFKGDECNLLLFQRSTVVSVVVVVA